GESLANEGLFALAPQEIHHQEAGQRTERGRGDVEHEAIGTARHHPDHEEVSDLGQGEERRIEEGDEIQAGCTQCERDPPDPGSYLAQRRVATNACFTKHTLRSSMRY